MSEDKIKELALKRYKDHMVKGIYGDFITKMILFGSYCKGTSREESDLDIMVFATSYNSEIERISSRVAFDILMETGEYIQSLIYSVDQYRNPSSYFVKWVIENGREIYSMEEDKLKYIEAQGLLRLAKEYLEIAQLNFDASLYRGCVDSAHNCSELCAKAFIRLATDDIPSSHRGILIKFGEIYLRGGELDRSLGSDLHLSLDRRNRVRYDVDAKIDKEIADWSMGFAKRMVEALEKRLLGDVASRLFGI